MEQDPCKGTRQNTGEGRAIVGGGGESSMEGQRELCLWNSRTCIGEITGV